MTDRRPGSPPGYIESATRLGFRFKAVRRLYRRFSVPGAPDSTLHTITRLRSALVSVRGYDAAGSGWIVGKIKDGYLWLRVDENGRATLSDLENALRMADLKLSLQKPNGSE